MEQCSGEFVEVRYESIMHGTPEVAFQVQKLPWLWCAVQASMTVFGALSPCSVFSGSETGHGLLEAQESPPECAGCSFLQL